MLTEAVRAKLGDSPAAGERWEIARSPRLPASRRTGPAPRR